VNLYLIFETHFLESELSENAYSKISGESRIRTCEVLTADLQSALVGRLSISPNLLIFNILKNIVKKTVFLSR
jgi:hypothetical protein